MSNRFDHEISITLVIIGLVCASCQTTKTTHVIDNSSLGRTEKKGSPNKISKNVSPELLDFEELKVLLKSNNEKAEASEKALNLFSSPFIDNSFYRSKGIPEPSYHKVLGPSIRISSWNIEKSLRIQQISEALKCEVTFKNNLKDKIQLSSKKYDKVLRQRLKLISSDILLTQEMDLGHSRSNYIFAAKKLAEELKMNFVYVPQQLEIDPAYLGLEQEVEFPNKADSLRSGEAPVNQKAYKGVFGVAVLSKYPIKRVQCFPLVSQPYDWFEREAQGPDFLERSRQFGAKYLFHTKFNREMKVGGRGFTRVDLHVPNVPNETISVINVHLEIKAQPKERVKQLEEILSYIKEIENSVILAGDFNSASRDLSATSAIRFISRNSTDPSNFLSAALSVANTMMVNPARKILNEVKNFQDPLAVNLPVILPNNTHSLFKTVEDFRFSDGGAFDFRGDKERSINENTGVLANANHRNGFKGFTYTFNLPRPIGPFGRERLDWIFVKSFLIDPRDKEGSYRLAPHFGETLSLINSSAKKRYSDHHPITAVIPLTEPQLAH